MAQTKYTTPSVETDLILNPTGVNEPTLKLYPSLGMAFGPHDAMLLAVLMDNPNRVMSEVDICKVFRFSSPGTVSRGLKTLLRSGAVSRRRHKRNGHGQGCVYTCHDDVIDRIISPFFNEDGKFVGGSRPSAIRDWVVPAELRERIFTRDGYRCLCCGAQDDLSIDHVTPVSAGGGIEEENLQTLCRPCNSRKGNKTTSYKNWGI